MIQHRSPPPQATALGSESSLQVQIGHEDPGLDPKRPMRCFVGGQFVGQITLADELAPDEAAHGALGIQPRVLMPDLDLQRRLRPQGRRLRRRRAVLDHKRCGAGHGGERAPGDRHPPIPWIERHRASLRPAPRCGNRGLEPSGPATKR